MKRIAILLILIPSLVAGCGSSSSVDAVLQELANCTGLGMEQLAGLVSAMTDLLDAIDDPTMPPPGVTYDEMTGAYSLDVDLDGDDIPDITVSGTVTSMDDLSDGLDVGESVNVTWGTGAPAGNGSAVNGSGIFDFTIPDATTLTVAGNGLISTGSTCSFNFMTTGVDLDTSGPDLMPLGTIDFDVVTPADSLSGTITFDGTQIARVTADFNGASVSFSINLDTFLVSF